MCLLHIWISVLRKLFLEFSPYEVLLSITPTHWELAAKFKKPPTLQTQLLLVPEPSRAGKWWGFYSLHCSYWPVFLFHCLHVNTYSTHCRWIESFLFYSIFQCFWNTETFSSALLHHSDALCSSVHSSDEFYLFFCLFVCSSFLFCARVDSRSHGWDRNRRDRRIKASLSVRWQETWPQMNVNIFQSLLSV